MIPIPYSIPPLTPAEAFVYIREHEYHRDAYCYSDYDTQCNCLGIFFKTLDGCPFEHDQPKLPPKKWEDMTEAEQQEHRHQEVMFKLMTDLVMKDMDKRSIWDELIQDSKIRSKSEKTLKLQESTDQ